MIKMFEAKMAGGVNDPDDLVVDAFKAFDEEVEEKVKGQMVTRHILEKENFIHILTAFGDKLTEDELDDNGDVMTKSVVDLFVAGAMDEKKEEEEEEKEGEPAEAAPAAGEEGAKKKKKKKRKRVSQQRQLQQQGRKVLRRRRRRRRPSKHPFFVVFLLILD